MVLILTMFGTRNSRANSSDTIIPMIPMTVNSRLCCFLASFQADAEANAYAIVAPTVVTSTIQLMAVRPKNGSRMEAIRMQRIALRGT